MAEHIKKEDLVCPFHPDMEALIKAINRKFWAILLALAVIFGERLWPLIK